MQQLPSKVYVQYSTAKVNKSFTIGSQSFARGASSQSCNKFVGSSSGIKFIIPRKPLVLCRDVFFTKCIANECLDHECETPVATYHEQFLKVVKYKLKCSHLTN